MVNTKGQWSPVKMDVGTAEGTSTKKMSEFVSEDREEITMESCGLADTWPLAETHITIACFQDCCYK